MGLDQYAYAVRPHSENTNFSYYSGKNNAESQKRVYLLAEWRKHPNLQGYMENLFNKKADAQGFEGVVKPGGINAGFSFTATAVDENGNVVEADSSVTERFSEIQDKLKEQLASMTAHATPARVFNNQPVRLGIHDLDQLEMAIKLGELPETTGFFFGENADEYYKEQDLAFIENARRALREGFEVYYDSWW